MRLNKTSKQIKGEHVEYEVRSIGMNQTTAKEAIPLFTLRDRRRIKYQIINDLLITESTDGDQYGNDDDDDGDREFHVIKIGKDFRMLPTFQRLKV
jgi:hypothetical protein